MNYLGKGLLGGACLLFLPFVAMAQDDKTVTIVLNEELNVLDPCASGQSNIGRVLQQNISETMTELNYADGTLMPRLAVSWEPLDDDTWRFKLREGVTFSDGTAFDADDVKHSIERSLSPDLVCENGVKFFGGIKLTMDSPDPLTIDITAEPAQPILPLLMSVMTIVPAETPMGEYVRKPIGTGPYVMTSYDVGRSIVLDRRDDYWGEKPEVTKATYVFRTDDAVRAAMVQAGEADIVPLISQVDATNPKTDFSYPNSETVFLRINETVAPFDDIRVRKALNMAVDREAFIGTLMPAEATIANRLVFPTTLGADEELHSWSYDPEGAKALLAEAKADGVPVDAAITMIGRLGNFPNVTETMEALQQMYADVGLNVKLNMVEVGEWVERYYRPFADADKPTLIEAMHDNNRGDPVFSVYFKNACEGTNSSMCDPELDKLIAEATGAIGDARADAWRKVFRRIDDEVHDVYLFHMVGFSRVSERLDFKPTIATNSELQLSQIKFK
ncbi:peptide ABC transporter substrate-binding protein [Sinirhodobacter populi]|uniref:Peptide ABC transporter substrate-binding protein n=1 Tax=Paenirhodobacter populi TaxID=2306993 RepID=A0A443K2W0_9RHOB|nr:ABC transporter substrate-binding protein [Sinirhodobacter populi]RWR27075.1 peptide ABC transporter substrate-binding protein [Sinirhodobacter populi]